jgi:hypothetical protein
MIIRHANSYTTLHNKTSSTIQPNPTSDTNCHILMIRHGICNENWIYCRLKIRNYKWLLQSHECTHCISHYNNNIKSTICYSLFNRLCLVAAANTGNSSRRNINCHCSLANCDSDCSSQSQNYVTTDGQSASVSWCQAARAAQNEIFVTVRQLRVCSWEGGCPLWREDGSVAYNCCWSSPAQSYLPRSKSVVHIIRIHKFTYRHST